MGRKLRSLAALAIVALIGAGCSNGSAENGTTGTASATRTASSSGTGANKKLTARDKAVKYADCMRDNGVSAFPDPDASGELTIDGVANGSSLDTSTAAFKTALSACKDLQPPGFMGRKRSAQEQENGLKFAQCMRDNGVEDFPDPAADGPLIDTNRIPSAAGRGARDIPGFQAAIETCRAALAGALGNR